MAFLGVLLALVLGLASWAEAQGPRTFYEGRTINFVVSTSPGGLTDIAARLVARHLGKHIFGHPDLVVRNMPGAGGITAANYVFRIAKPDGLTILAVNRANYLEQMVGRPEVKFDFRKFSWIGSFNRAPMMIACRANTPYTSVEGLRAGPTPPRLGSSGAGSISYIFGNLVAGILNLKIKHVTGYGSGREIDLGMERGEVDCRATSDITVLRSPWPRWMKQGFVSFVLQQGPRKSSLLPPQIPTVHELASAEAKPTLDLMEVALAYTEFDRPYAAPPGVPEERLRLLREGFERMLKDVNFKNEAKRLLDWDGSAYLSGTELQKKIEKTVTQPPEMIRRIKEILGG